jgi:hypothetical protein
MVRARWRTAQSTHRARFNSIWMTQAHCTNLARWTRAWLDAQTKLHVTVAVATFTCATVANITVIIEKRVLIVPPVTDAALMSFWCFHKLSE